MGETIQRVSRVIRQSDVLLEVVDSRFPHRSERLRRMARRRGIPTVLVLSKVDFLPDNGKKISKKMEGIAFSAKTRRGKRMLLAQLKEMGENVHVGVVGRPNSGKSSLINVLKGRKSAKTSPTAGYTKGEQWIRITKNVLLIDSPGVITWDEPQADLIIEDSLSIDKTKNPVSAALLLFEKHPEVLQNLGLQEKGENALDEFAKKTGKLKKGGFPNTPEAAKMIIRRWQRGKIKKIKK